MFVADKDVKKAASTKKRAATTKRYRIRDQYGNEKKVDVIRETLASLKLCDLEKKMKMEDVTRCASFIDITSAYQWDVFVVRRSGRLLKQFGKLFRGIVEVYGQSSGQQFSKLLKILLSKSP